MATTPTLFLEWNDDLKITPSGSVQMASDWDIVRQRIIRRIITNSAQELPDGTFTPPDYVWDPSFGIGLGSMVDQPFNAALISRLEAAITRGVLLDAAVESSIPPSIKFVQPNLQTLWISIGVTVVGCGAGVIQFAIQQAE